MAHFGIDVSSNDNRPIDYQAVVNDLQSRGGGDKVFCFVKATESTGYTNPYYNEDVAGFKGAGAVVGAYLFDHGTAVVAAEDSYFRSVVGNSIPGADDMEDPQGVNYVAHTADLLQVDPNRLVYLNQAEVQEGIPTGAGLWLAQYDYDPTAPPNYPCLIKQYSDQGPVAGISGAVDLNVWCGTEAQFQSYFNLQETDLTPQESQMLSDLHAQMAGAWPSFVDPAANVTPVDFLRWIDKHTAATNGVLFLFQEFESGNSGPVAPAVYITDLIHTRWITDPQSYGDTLYAMENFATAPVDTIVRQAAPGYHHRVGVFVGPDPAPPAAGTGMTPTGT